MMSSLLVRSIANDFSIIFNDLLRMESRGAVKRNVSLCVSDEARRSGNIVPLWVSAITAAVMNRGAPHQRSY